MKKHVSLTTSIFIMMILGMAAGYVASDLMVQLKFVGDIFLRLIQMSIVLLVMGSVVEAIASLDLHSLGRLGRRPLPASALRRWLQLRWDWFLPMF